MSRAEGQLDAAAVLDAELRDVDDRPATLRAQLPGAAPLVVVLLRHFG